MTTFAEFTRETRSHLGGSDVGELSDDGRDDGEVVEREDEDEEPLQADHLVRQR